LKNVTADAKEGEPILFKLDALSVDTIIPYEKKDDLDFGKKEISKQI
jgi:hypothetical protein